VFNATSICASKETGRLRVSDQDKLDKETAATASPRRSVIALRQVPVMVRAINATPMSASRTHQIPPTQPRADMSQSHMIVLPHRVFPCSARHQCTPARKRVCFQGSGNSHYRGHLRSREHRGASLPGAAFRNGSPPLLPTLRV
jgi:hypothetical protein